MLVQIVQFLPYLELIRRKTGKVLFLFLTAIVLKHAYDRPNIFEADSASLLLVNNIEGPLKFLLRVIKAGKLIHHGKVFEGKRAFLLHVVLLEDSFERNTVFGESLVEGGYPLLEDQFLLLTV